MEEKDQEVDLCAFHSITAEFPREENCFDPRDLIIVRKAKVDLSNRLLSRAEGSVGLVLAKEKREQKEGGKEPNGMFPEGRGYSCQEHHCEGPGHTWRPWILLHSSVQCPYHTHIHSAHSSENLAS